MNRINYIVLLAWLTCVLVLRVTTASVTAQETTGPPQSPGTAIPPHAPASVRVTVMYRESTFPNGQGTLTGSKVLTVQLGDMTRADALTAVPAVAIARSSFDLAIDDGRLARFSR